MRISNREENLNGILKIGGVPCDTLARACGTPLYIYDEKAMEIKIEDYLTYFKSDLFDTEIIYASKAFSCKAMIQLINKHGCSVDVVSGGELYLAYRAGMPMSKIYFHGNNKNEEEKVMVVK